MKNDSPGNKVEEFNEYRTRMNDALLDGGNLTLKRLFHLDSSAYSEGALSVRTKEMLGLMGSLVLRCDDCIQYHVGQSHAVGMSKDELLEVFSIALVVGGTIVIPHSRRALEYWETLEDLAMHSK
jgi:AhpD family alkylhydroperoxidase